MRNLWNKSIIFFSLEITFKQFAAFTILIALFFLFVLPTNSYDRGYWRDWINTINTEGFINVYSNPSVNYPPLVLYLLSIFAGIVKFFTGSDTLATFDFNIHLFKGFFLVFDLLVILLTAYITRQHRKNTVWGFLLLFNIGFWYNTLVFGQTDSMFVALSMLAVWLAYVKRFNWSALVMTLAILAKFQTVLWIPMWGIVVIYGLRRVPPRHIFNQLLNMLGIFVATAAIAYLPFILGGTLGEAVNGAYFTSTQTRRDELAVNAFNSWHILMPLNQTKISPNTISSLGISYDTIGTILVLLGFLITACIYIIRSSRAGKLIKFSFARLMLLQGLLSLIFFFFSTRMHERYAHSAVVALLVYAAIERKWLLAIMISLPYYLNLATVVEYGGSIIDGRYLVLPSRLVAWVYVVALLLSLWNWAGGKIILVKK